MRFHRRTLYLAAPYSSAPVLNTNRAIRVAQVIYDEWKDWFPVVPHLSMLSDLVTPADADYWYVYTLDQMLTCDAIVRLPGESQGADYEEIVADQHEIHFVDYDLLPEKARAIWEGKR